MEIRKQVLVLDTTDLAASSSFWAGVLGGTVAADDDWHTVLVDGEPRLGFQLAPNYVPPQWPDGEQQQQLHLDLYVDDVAAAHEEVTALGARRVQAGHEAGAPEGFWVYTDPVGHTFCLCWGD